MIILIKILSWILCVTLEFKIIINLLFLAMILPPSMSQGTVDTHL